MGFRTTTLGILGGLAAALGLAIALWRPPAPPGPPLTVLPEGAEVVSLDVDFGRPIRLERRVDQLGRSAWRIVSPAEAAADPGIVDAMIAALDVARPRSAAHVAARSPDQRFGLTPPRGRVAIGLAGGRAVTVEFGAAAPLRNAVYARVSTRADVVLSVDEALLRSLDRSPGDLRDRRLWAVDPGRIRALEVRGGGVDVRVERSGDAWRVVPPGSLADPERAGRLFGLLAAPRAAAFLESPACPPGPAVRLAVDAGDGVRRELTVVPDAPCAGCPAGAVIACTGAPPVVAAIDGTLVDDARDASSGLARTALLGALDPADVVDFSVTARSGAWTLRRTAEGWRAEGGAIEIDEEAAKRWLRAVAAVVVDPAKTAEGAFAAVGSLTLRLRGGTSVRVERGAVAADGTVAVRRETEAVAFVLGPADAYLLAAPEAHLRAAAAAGCDPLAVVEIGVVAAGGAPVQTLRRRERDGAWLFGASDLAVDAAGADLLAGDLCRLPAQTRLPAETAPGSVEWTVVLLDETGDAVLGAEVRGPSAGVRGRAAAIDGVADLRLLPEAAVDRLRRPLVAPDALAVPSADGLELVIDPPAGVPVRLVFAGGAWTAAGVPGPLAEAVGRALAAPRFTAALSLGRAGDPSADWPVRFRVSRRPAGGAVSSFVVGGPDAAGRILLWDETSRGEFEVDPSLVGTLILLQAVATTGR